MRGRLYICRSGRFIGAWSAKRNTRGQWLQVTTSKEAVIRDAYKQYVVVLHSVSRYRLSLLKYWFGLLQGERSIHNGWTNLKGFSSCLWA